MARDEFVLVKSEDELRPGMCVELRPCLRCGKRDRRILTGALGRGDTVDVDGIVSRAVIFYATGICPPSPGFRGDTCGFSRSIRERRLYRLRDDDTAADETATTRRKERVR